MDSMIPLSHRKIITVNNVKSNLTTVLNGINMSYIQPHPSKLFLLQNERIQSLELEVQELREVVEKLAKLSNVEFAARVEEPEPTPIPPPVTHNQKQFKNSSAAKKDKISAS